MASRRQHVSIGYDGDATASVAVRDNGILPSRALPELKEADNAALALDLIPSGTPLIVDGKIVSSGSEHDIPEGHRFAVVDIAKGESVRSWGLPFAVATRDCKAGDYLCNSKVLATFIDRQSTLKLPAEPNLKNIGFHRFTQDKDLFRPAAPVSIPPTDNSFDGYSRLGGRGGGTRNYVVILAVSSQAGSFARALERKFAGKGKGGTCDGVVAVAHTEGGLDVGASGEEGLPNNLRKTIRTLSGFVVHPNVGSVLLVDRGSEVLRVQVSERSDSQEIICICLNRTQLDHAHELVASVNFLRSITGRLWPHRQQEFRMSLSSVYAAPPPPAQPLVCLLSLPALPACLLFLPARLPANKPRLAATATASAGLHARGGLPARSCAVPHHDHGRAVCPRHRVR